MNPDQLSNSMFWAGALLALTPLVIGGIAVALWWRTFKRPTDRDPSGALAPGEEGEGQGQHGESHGTARERERAPR